MFTKLLCLARLQQREFLIRQPLLIRPLFLEKEAAKTTKTVVKEIKPLKSSYFWSTVVVVVVVDAWRLELTRRSP